MSVQQKMYFNNQRIVELKTRRNVQSFNSNSKVLLDGYGVAVKDFQNPVIDFNRNNTYIQSEGINQDFGVYDSPD